jgi:hypothetical protein
MKQKSTATKVKDLTRYNGEVSVYQLSKAIKKDIKFVVVARNKPRYGSNWINIWASDEEGVVKNNLPIKSLGDISIEEALNELGYKLK